MANGIVLNIDTTKSEFQNPMVQLRQGDGNYQSLAVTVTSNGEPFDLTGWTTTFMGTTAGGFKIIDSTVTVTNALQGSLTYTPTKAWGQDQGEFKNAYFKFTKSDETASGASFRVNVLDAVDLTAEEAGDYISVIDALIDDVKTSMDNKLSETKQTLADTQSQANTVQANVNDLNTSVNNLKTQNLNIKTNDNTWTGQNTFTQLIDGYTKTQVAPNTDLNLIKKSGKYGIGDPASYKNLPTNNISSYKMLIVEDVLGAGVFYQTLYERRVGFSTADIYFRSFYAGNWLPWTKTSHDDEVLHLTGNETVAGDKNFTGNTSFSGGIKGGQVNLPASGDINTLTDTGKYYQAMSVNASNWTNRPSNAPNLSFSVDVIGQANKALATQVYYVHTTSRMWVRTMWMNGATIATSQWTELANDNNVVHNTGTETIAGDKTFTGTTSLSNGASITTKTANVTSKGISVNFIETAFGVEVNITESGNTTLPANDTWGILGNIPATISTPKQSVFTSANVTATIGGVTRTNFLLILSFNTNREINYRLIFTRENDNTTTYVPVFRTWLSANWFK